VLTRNKRNRTWWVREERRLRKGEDEILHRDVTECIYVQYSVTASAMNLVKLESKI
jgi:hypothetical protein